MRAVAMTARIIPSAVAVERVLWLAAVDRRLRLSGDDPAAVVAAYHALRAVIDRDAPALYRATPTDDAAERAWIARVAPAIVAPAVASTRAAIVLWAAVEAWTDAPSGRWSRLADAGAHLAQALDATGPWSDATGPAATALRVRLRGAT